MLEHIAHAGGAHPHEHLNKLGAANAKKRYISLTGDRARQQGLACSGVPHEQNTPRNLGSQAAVLLGVAQIIDDLAQIAFCSIQPRDVVKCRPRRLGLAVTFRRRFAKAEYAPAHLATALLHAVAHVDEQPQDQHPGQRRDHQHLPPRITARLSLQFDIVRLQQGHQFRIIKGWPGRGKPSRLASGAFNRLGLVEQPVDRLAFDGDLPNMTVLKLALKLRVGVCEAGVGLRGAKYEGINNRQGPDDEQQTHQGGHGVVGRLIRPGALVGGSYG